MAPSSFPSTVLTRKSLSGRCCTALNKEEMLVILELEHPSAGLYRLTGVLFNTKINRRMFRRNPYNANANLILKLIQKNMQTSDFCTSDRKPDAMYNMVFISIQSSFSYVSASLPESLSVFPESLSSPLESLLFLGESLLSPLESSSSGILSR